MKACERVSCRKQRYFRIQAYIHNIVSLAAILYFVIDLFVFVAFKFQRSKMQCVSHTLRHTLLHLSSKSMCNAHQHLFDISILSKLARPFTLFSSIRMQPESQRNHHRDTRVNRRKIPISIYLQANRRI